jgi:threonine dehydratase
MIILEGYGSREMLIAVIGALGGGGLFLGITALMKVRPERGKIIVESAGAVVVMQKDLIDNLQEQVTSLKQDLEDVKSERDGLRNRIRNMEVRMLQLETQNDERQSN